MRKPSLRPLIPLAACAALLLTGPLAGCDSTSAPSLLASGKELSAKGDSAGAILQFKGALQKDPEALEARVLLGKLLLKTGDVDGASVELARALASRAPAEQVVPWLAQAWVAAGEHKKLIHAHGETVLGEPVAQAMLQVQLAHAWAELSNAAKSDQAIEAALKASPDFGPAVLLKARRAAAKGQVAEAETLVRGALTREPKFHEAWAMLGELQAGTDVKAAQESFGKALALEPAYVPAHASLIILRLGAKDMPGAKQQLARLQSVAPRHPATALLGAHVAYLEGQLTVARDAAQKLLLSYPSHPGILLLAGSVEAGLGTVSQAAALFGKALAINPQLVAAREALAEAEMRLGQSDKARLTLKPLVDSSGATSRSLFLAGEVEMRLGAPEVAERLFRQAAKMSPGDNRLQTAALAARMSGADPLSAVAELRALSERSVDTYADEALFASNLRRRELDAALADLDRMERKRPSHAPYAELRGRVLLNKGDTAGARSAFEQALKLDPGMFAAVQSLVALDLGQGRPEQAATRLRDVIKANPRNANALLALADLRVAQDAPQAEVKALLAEAVAASPTLPEAHLMSIEYALRKRQHKEALSLVQQALTTLPSDLKILGSAGTAQVRAGDLEQAVSTFRRMAGMLPNSALPYLRLAEVYQLQGKGDAVLVAARKAIELEPTNAAAQAALLDALMRDNQKGQAADYVRRLRQAKPNEPLGYALEAAYHQRNRDNEAAVRLLREGVARTDDSRLAVRLYEALYRSGKPADAARFGEDWLRKHPNDALVEYAVSVGDMSRGDLGKAGERLARVLAVMPNNSQALNSMAWVRLRTGGKDALAFARRAVEMTPDTPMFMDTLAQAMAADNQLKAAMDLQRRAIELAPADKMLRLTLAKLALQSGDKSTARDELTQLQKLGKDFGAHAEVSRLLQGL